VSSGTWYLIANADDERAIAETVETNNTRAVSLLVGPDLSVTTFTLPFTVSAGSAITVSDSVKNVGAAEAGASTIRFYLSTNALLDAEDQLLGGRSVPALAAGATSTGTTPITIPLGISGACYVFAVADGTSVVAEASETNNMFVRFVQVTK
jgi:subtilase family serine protease